MLFRLLLLVVAPIALLQVRKPMRGIGRPFLWLMNCSHSALTNWGLSHVAIGRDASVLDVGCGGGRTLRKLAAIAINGNVSGVDYSAESCAVSRAANADAIRERRLKIREASVAKLPFESGRFDVVTAVETHYYWPSLVDGLKEIHRVIKPGGSAIVIAEAYSHGRFSALPRLVMTLLGSPLLTADEHREAFMRAGFSGVQVFEEPRRGWICVRGQTG